MATEPLRIHECAAATAPFLPAAITLVGRPEDLATESSGRRRRELQADVLCGAYDEGDSRSSKDDPFERAPLECYSRDEISVRAGSVDWEVVFDRAGVPEQYRQSWRRLLLPNAKIRDVPDADYRWIRRARTEPWRSRILSAIREERKTNPQFGRASFEWGASPEGQGSVSTLCRSVSVSPTLYWKRGDRPGLLTRRRTTRTMQRYVTGCEGFRANFRGAQLEEYRASFRAGIAQLVSERWIPDTDI